MEMGEKGGVGGVAKTISSETGRQGGGGGVMRIDRLLTCGKLKTARGGTGIGETEGGKSDSLDHAGHTLPSVEVDISEMGT